jgi:hypothetical protein
MSLMQACADVEAAIAHARSLFAGGEAVGVPDSAGPITQAVHAVTAARSRTADLSGAGVRSYQAVADGSLPPLLEAAGSDTRLAAHVTTAAAVNQAGAARLEQIAATTRAITQAAPMATSASAQRVILTALRSQLSQTSLVMQSTQQQASALTGQVRALDYPKDAPAQGLSHDLPQGPAPAGEPPHGKDPRYWIDVGKIIYVPDGTLAPTNTVQIGPGMWYPAPSIPDAVSPPPNPVTHPLNPSDVRVVEPHQLLPPGYKLVTPTVGLPDPAAGYQPAPAWAPKSPVDVRDVLHIAPGQLAPWGYREYLPGWWAPDPTASSPD